MKTVWTASGEEIRNEKDLADYFSGKFSGQTLSLENVLLPVFEELGARDLDTDELIDLAVTVHTALVYLIVARKAEILCRTMTRATPHHLALRFI